MNTKANDLGDRYSVSCEVRKAREDDARRAHEDARERANGAQRIVRALSDELSVMSIHDARYAGLMLAYGVAGRERDRLDNEASRLHGVLIERMLESLHANLSDTVLLLR